MNTGDQNHALALAIIERKHAEIVALTQRAEAAEADAHFQMTWRFDANRELVAIIERKHAEIAALTQRAEAAEAERDEMEQQVLSAERNALAVSLSQRWRPMRLDETKAECDTLRAERDALLVINGDLARDNETLEAERDALRTSLQAMELSRFKRLEHARMAIAFFASVIRSGEPWSPHCQKLYDAGMYTAALAVQPTTEPRMSEPRAIDEPRVITALHLLRDLGFTALYDAEENLAADIADILDAWDALTAQLAVAKADGERLDWLEARAFTVYRQRDPEHGTLPDHITVVDEDVRFRIGILGATVRAALDAALAVQP